MDDLSRLRLALRFGSRPLALGRLLQRCSLHDLLAGRGPGLPAAPSPDRLLRVRDSARRLGWRLLFRGESGFPPLLAQIPDAPGMLFVRGDPALLAAPQLALVGSRTPSAEGLRHTRFFARELAARGFAITSGLARGIDAAAHEAALTVGRTVAVLPCGIDRVAPRQHGGLAQRILAGGGALVSEFPPGQEAQRHTFPIRNRLIAGLALGTLVTQAASASGSLITARLAAEQGRPVFAMPGPIHHPGSTGCHQLLRDGALWLESLDDIARAFPSFHDLATGAEPEDPLLASLEAGVTSLDRLGLMTGQSPDLLTQRLTALELAGKVRRTATGYMRL